MTLFFWVVVQIPYLMAWVRVGYFMHIVVVGAADDQPLHAAVLRPVMLLVDGLQLREGFEDRVGIRVVFGLHIGKHLDLRVFLLVGPHSILIFSIHLLKSFINFNSPHCSHFQIKINRLPPC